MVKCEKLTGLGVADLHKRTEALPIPPSISVNEVEEAQVGPHEQQQHVRGEEKIAAAAPSEGLLLLPPQLQDMWISDCQNLVLCLDILDGDKDEGRTGGVGLQGLRSLRSLDIRGCPRFLSSYSSSSSCFPFPASLERLFLEGAEDIKTLLSLSNLTSLTDLAIRGCGDLRGEGLRPLLAQGRLTELTVHKTPNFFTGSEPSPLHEQEFPSSSSKLKELRTDDVAGLLAAPTCALLSSSLTELHFWGDEEVERFKKEQEEALQLLTSLERIQFWKYDKLQRLTAGLHILPNLKILDIYRCPAIRSLPKECLPSSLQTLGIANCQAIRSLPKVDDLPSSLRELDVRLGNSEELRRQCRKLIGTIPTVRV
ncbi:putative disease resistance protein RGA3 [Panicum miliaceum]|uniref:Disease resistance protein RGA3 n=1 Tax=Panicum miliaceum TaxID=4540 RepID=A0A3L6PY48_PANMI|nr:putative disease resistance protein RGA3 [Panicum miliaceum]